MKDLDVTVLKTLSNKTNVIPVIAKADTMTAEERKQLKSRVSLTQNIKATNELDGC